MHMKLCQGCVNNINLIRGICWEHDLPKVKTDPEYDPTFHDELVLSSECEFYLHQELMKTKGALELIIKGIVTGQI
jgi:hypothetical protein